MVNVTVGSTLNRLPAQIVTADTKIIDLLEDYQQKTGFDYTRGVWNVSGAVVRDFGSTLGDLGLEGKTVFLLNVAKADNA